MADERHRRSRQAQGGPALHHRQGPLHRRHQPARPGLRRLRALARTPTRAIRGIDTAAAEAMPGRARGATPARTSRPTARQPDLRLAAQRPRRLAHEEPPAPAARPGQGRATSATGRGRHRRDARAGHATPPSWSRSTTRSCPRCVDARAGARPGPPQVHDEVADNLLRLGARRQGGGRRGVRQGAPHVTKHRPRQQPPDPQRHGAARRDRRVRPRRRRATRSTPPARTRTSPAADGRLRARHARAQAAGDRARRRRRLRLEDLPLRRGVRRHLGRRRARPAGEVDRRAHARLPHRRARPRPRHRRRAGARRGRQRSSRCGSNTNANLGAYLSTFAPCDPDLPLRHAARRPVHDAGDLLRGAGGLHQHRAGRRLSRRRPARGDATCSSAWSTTAAREIGHRPGRDPAAELHPQGRLPLPDAGRAHVRHRRLRGDARQGARARRLRGLRARRKAESRGQAASCAASASPPTSRPAASRPRRWSARSAPAPASARAPRCACTPPARCTVFTGSHSHGQGHETTFAQVVADELGMPIEDVEIVHGDTDKIPFGMGTYGSRSLAVGGSAIVKALRQDHRQGQEDRRAPAGGGRGRHRVQGRRASRSPAPTSRRRSARSRSTAYVPHNYPHGKLEPGLEETAFYDPPNFIFPAGTYVCEVEVDPDDRRGRDRALRRGGRLRQRHQPDDRRGPGARRHRPGHRPGAARELRLRRRAASS